MPLGFTGEAPSAPVQDRTALTGADDDIAETIRAYKAAGVDEIVVSVSTRDIEENNDAMAHFMERVWRKV